jgi:hypothetical protein
VLGQLVQLTLGVEGEAPQPAALDSAMWAAGFTVLLYSTFSGSTPSFWSIWSSAQEAISKLEPSRSKAASSSGSELHFTA